MNICHEQILEFQSIVNNNSFYSGQTWLHLYNILLIMIIKNLLPEWTMLTKTGRICKLNCFLKIPLKFPIVVPVKIIHELGLGEKLASC